MILVYNCKIIEVFDTYEQRENGKLINDCIYPMGEVLEVNAPDYVIPNKYSYTTEKGFYINEEWRNSKLQIEAAAKDSLVLELIKGGLI